jgi:hypothetical protein
MDFADMPDLQSGSDSDDESVWLSEGDESDYDLLDNVSNKDWEVISVVDDITAPATHPPGQECSELYDSGATKHMSPYCDEFTTI